MRHGLSWHPLYTTWQRMKKRCGLVPFTPKAYKRNYIDRGITVCDEWRTFLFFYRWAKNKLRPGLQLDRKNNNGNYTPENCRFVTNKVNSQNSVNAKRWYIKGRKYNSCRDAGRAVNVSQGTIRWWCNNPNKKDCYAINLY